METATEPTLIERLKAGIWDIHEGVTNGVQQAPPEEDNIMKGTLPKAKYVASLGQRYLLLRAFEMQLAAARAKSTELASVVTDEQFHAPKSVADLKFFGVDAQKVKALQSTVAAIDFVDACASKGWRHVLAIHYVIEGSNNGARFIAKAVRKAYDLEGLDGTWHLDPYGEEQRGKWKAFGEAFNKLSISDAEMQDMVDVGRQTFAHLNKMGAEAYAAAAEGK